jgi:uncharacterized protein YdaU (DUF1376 family)
MSGASWVKFFPSDWLTGTMVLDAMERGIYITLIAMMYDAGGPITADENRLAKRCGTTLKGYRRAIKTLIDEGKIEEIDGKYINNRVEFVLQEAAARIEKASKGGQAFAQKKAKEKQGDEEAQATREPQSRRNQDKRKPPPSLGLEQAIPEPEPEASKLANAREDLGKEDNPAATLEAELRHAAAWHHDAPKLAHVQPIADLIAKGLDLHRDVIPLIRQIAPSVTHQTSWKYFLGPLNDILTTRARLQGATDGGMKPAENHGSTPAADAQIAVYEDTPQYEAWAKHEGRRPWTFDIRPPGRLQIRKGFYAPSEWPPGMESAETPPEPAKTEDAA